MAVVIDMTMPETCGKCPFNDDDWACIISGKPVEDGKRRPESCPLHQVVWFGADLSKEESFTGYVNLTDEAKKTLFPPYTAPGSSPSGQGPNPTEINRGDGAAPREEVKDDL